MLKKKPVRRAAVKKPAAKRAKAKRPARALMKIGAKAKTARVARKRVIRKKSK